MNRALATLNLFGVLALTGLCILQWRSNRSLNLDINALEHTTQSQASLVDKQSEKIRGLTEDLDHFRGQLGTTTLSQKDTEQKLRASEHLAAQLSSERDQLKASIAQWTAAVAARDTNLQEANDRIHELTTQLSETVAKYNTLAAIHNTLVQQINDARDQTNGDSSRTTTH
ncbi:MAG TPA: hypothetical protein VL357_02720 [Rariglobus sp.]|jgi:chromosome segregation ATPase|nr:hypothetical protein [Rariglobus sp.]